VRIVDVLRMRDSSGSERRRHSGGCRARRIVAPPAGKIQCGIIIIIMIIIKIIIITTIIIIIISDLGRRITQSTDDHCESAFLFQRLSVLIQRYNAVAVLGTFAHTTPEDEM